MQGISNSNVTLSYLNVSQEATIKNLTITDNFNSQEATIKNLTITDNVNFPSSTQFQNVIFFQKYIQNTIIIVPEKAVSVFIQCQGPGGNGGDGICSSFSCSGGSGGGGGAYAEKLILLQDINYPQTLSLTVNQSDMKDTFVSHQPIGYLCYAGAGKNGQDGTDQINLDSNIQYVKGGNCGQGIHPVYESGGYANLGGYGTKGIDSFFQYGAGGGAGGGCLITSNTITAFHGGYGGAVLVNNLSSQINNQLRGTPGAPNKLDGENGGGGCATRILSTISNPLKAGNGGNGLEGCGGGGGGSFGYPLESYRTLKNKFSILKGVGGRGGLGYIKITFYS